MKQEVFERGDHLYIVSQLRASEPTGAMIEEYAFGRNIVADLREKAPNNNLAWFSGHYVQGDIPNLNGAMFLSSELAIKSLTPIFCPVTIMHDARTAVGLIADVKLSTPPEVPRAKLDTAVALWRHRFPEAVEEAMHNASQGTLYQSMETIAPRYGCSHCREVFHKLPDGAERAQWCDHLKASQPTGGYTAAASGGNSNASRILMDVTFTGTGLIFGSRGATGADPEANLEAFQEEVAEYHAKTHRDTYTKKPRPKRSKRMAEIDDREYAELLAAKSKSETLATEVVALGTKVSEYAELQKRVTTLEAEKVAAETAKTEAEKKVTAFEEKANQEALRDQRWEALGNAFVEKIDSMPTTKSRLLSEASSMEEAAWDERLKEIEEITTLKRDAKKDGTATATASKDNPIFTKEEVASFQPTHATGQRTETPQTKESRRSVVAGLVRPPKKSS